MPTDSATAGDQEKGGQGKGSQETRALEEVAGEAIFWANKAKDFERYEISNRVFPVLLSLLENNEEEVRDSRIEAGVTVREDRRKSGKLSNGYRDLAWIVVGDQELCLPIPKLSRKYACWFYAHAERREEKSGQRETSEGREEQIRKIEREASRAVEELKSGWKITNPGHYLTGGG